MARSLGALSWMAVCAVLFASGAWLGRALQPVRVAGGSMRPALESGDIVLVARRGCVSPRDIALIAEPGRAAVLHRVIGRTPEGSWITRGDANPTADLRPVEPSSIVGRVVRVLHTGAAVREWRQAVGGATLANQSDSTRR